MSDDLKKIMEVIEKHNPNAVKHATEIMRWQMAIEDAEKERQQELHRQRHVMWVNEQIRARQAQADESHNAIYSDIALNLMAGKLTKDEAHELIESVAEVRENRTHKIAGEIAGTMGKLAVEGKMPMKYLNPKVLKELLKTKFK